MKLLIVRHGDPDYTIDSLTPKGWKEVNYLSEKLAKLDVKAFYVSPLGRARDTASLTLKKMNRTATEEPWLREFDARIHRPDVPEKEMVSWDWLPQDWTAEPRFYLPDEWWKVPVMMEGHVKEEYDWVTTNFDALLASHGYVRDGLTYRAEHANNDTIVFFCHFGLECVLLSHLLHISPMILWHGTCAAPSSVTTLVTEERRPGIAYFRMSSFGDISIFPTCTSKTSHRHSQRGFVSAMTMRMRDTINCYLNVPVHRFVNNCIIHAGYGFECAIQKTVAIESHIEISVTTVFYCSLCNCSLMPVLFLPGNHGKSVFLL